jgi:hypothetical protein
MVRVMSGWQRGFTRCWAKEGDQCEYLIVEVLAVVVLVLAVVVLVVLVVVVLVVVVVGWAKRV